MIERNWFHGWIPAVMISLLTPLASVAEDAQPPTDRRTETAEDERPALGELQTPDSTSEPTPPTDFTWSIWTFESTLRQDIGRVITLKNGVTARHKKWIFVADRVKIEHSILRADNIRLLGEEGMIVSAPVGIFDVSKDRFEFRSDGAQVANFFQGRTHILARAIELDFSPFRLRLHDVPQSASRTPVTKG